MAGAMPIIIEKSRREHFLEAEVIRHGTHVSGGWFRKREKPTLVIRLFPDSHSRIVQILAQIAEIGRITLPELPAEIEIGMLSEAARDRFGIGEMVEIVFSTSNGFDTSVLGAEPIRFERVQKTNRWQ